MRTNGLVLIGLLLASPAALHAQRPLLDQVDGSISNGTFTEARTLLQRWRRENPRPEEEQQARYHLLTARMLMNADSAEDAYLNVAVNFSTSRVAPEALLRLAQARHARGDTTQAIEYVERVLSDYPESDQRPMAAVWLARLHGGTGTNTALCQTLRAVAPGNNPESADLLRAEQRRACGSVPTSTTTAARTPPRTVRTDTTRAQPQPQPQSTPPRTAPTTSPAADKAGRVAIQIGAFREVSGARDVKAQLERLGFADARMVRVPGNNLIRVRIGRFANRTAAAATLARLASADISAVLVTDADSETVVKN